MTYVLDIETVPVVEEVAKVLESKGPEDFTAPGNYKKPESIEAYQKKAWADWCEDVRSKAALSPVTGKIAAICMVDADDERVILAEAGPPERDLLDALMDRLDAAVRLVTFNGHEFDLPFIRGRVFRLGGITMPSILGMAESPWRYDRHVDVRGLVGWNKKGGLVDTARQFGVREPIPHTADQIATWYADGENEQLCNVCLSDCVSVMDIYNRLIETGGMMPPHNQPAKVRMATYAG